jgi:hypothetical protein
VYTAQDDRWIEKGLGFLVGPALGYAVARKAHSVPVGLGTGGVASYLVSENVTSQEIQAFARGSMWGHVALGVLYLIK